MLISGKQAFVGGETSLVKTTAWEAMSLENLTEFYRFFYCHFSFESNIVIAPLLPANLL